MDIIKQRKKFYIISAVVIIIGLISMAVSGLNFGIDFTGGTLIQLDLEKQAPIEEVRDVMDEFDKDAEIIFSGDNKQEVIIKSTLNLSREESTKIFEKYKEEFNLETDKPEQVEAIGATIGKEIQKKALLSVLIASIGILIYVSIRFEIKFGVAAVLGLVHDVLVMLSIYAVFKLPIDSTFIAAILTVIGYSINDTIVIFDRMRENLKLTKGKDVSALINTSVKQTIRRTLSTSFTTLVMIGLLFALGTEAIRSFALPLMLGVVVGTYSSLFVASPIWYELKTRDSK